MTLKTDIETAKLELNRARNAFVNARTQADHDACKARLYEAIDKVNAFHPSGIMN